MFDIESNGLLKEVSKVHCICARELGTEERFKWKPDEVPQALEVLMKYLKDDKIGGHNIIEYDIPALEKLYPRFRVPRNLRSHVVDSLVLSRLIFSNVKELDYGLLRAKRLPASLLGSHKLEAWGYRLGNHKGEYGKQKTAWENFSEDMLTYCMQDVDLNCGIFDKLFQNKVDERAYTLEHKAQWLIAQMGRNGFPFDIEGAHELEGTLRADLAVEESKILQAVPTVPDKWDEEGRPIPSLIPKRDNKTKGYIAGVPVFREKDFNYGSRKQLEYVIKHHYHYLPDETGLYDIPDEEAFDPNYNRLKMDEETFKYISKDPKATDELKTLAHSMYNALIIKKRLGQLSDGQHSWYTHYDEDDGCIHGRVIANGAVSGRATHSSPNVAQVPAVGAPYGSECRALWKAQKVGNEGWVQVGVDASGLELRCLSHYMSPYDNGNYGHIILNGDIHTANQEAAGLPTRNNAKTFIYAFLYGAGDAKIGKIVGGDASDGKRLKKAFLTKTPAIKLLRDAVRDTLVEEQHGRVKRWKRKYLKGLDGRYLWVRSPHSALNLLLQGCGAIICKYWIVLTEEMLIAKGLKHGWDGDFAYLMWIHDEIQVSCRNKEVAQVVIDTAQEAMRQTGSDLGVRITLDTDGKIGMNWRDCH